MVGTDLTSRALEKALSVSQLRQRVLAHNVANINTPGFKRSHVEFEAALAAAVEAGRGVDQVTPRIVQENRPSGRPDGNNVDLEYEMTQMAQNQIDYAALTRQISDHFGRLRTVIYDGRR